MRLFEANSREIIYVGKWNEKDTTKISERDFCRFAVVFKGKTLKIEADGEVLCSLDGGVENNVKEFCTDDGVHILLATVMEGVCVKSFEAEKIFDADAYMRTATNNEYVEILQGREGSNPRDWKPVSYKAKAPEENVELSGLFGRLFDINVKRVKTCYNAPYYLECNVGKENSSSSGWVDWLPAANEGGRVLGGAAYAYRWTKDEELKEIIDALVKKMSNNAREDGYYNYYDVEKSYAVNCFPYIENLERDILDSERKNFDRTFWTYGVIAAGKAGNKDAYVLARRMYDWLEKSPWCRQLILGHNVTNALMGSMIIADSEVGCAEDVLLNQRYLDRKSLEKEMAAKNPLVFSNYPGDRPHCYDVLEMLTSLYEYRFTGEQHYIEAVLGGWEVYRKYYKHLGGLTAICECEGPYYPGSYYMATRHTGESCGTIFWIWLNQELLQLYPDEEKYAAEIEESLLNVIPSLIVPGVGVRYHNRLVGKKNVGESVNVSADGSCCELMTTLIHSELPKYGFIYDDQGIQLNQFMSYKASCGGFEFEVEADIFKKKSLHIKLLETTDTEKYIKVRIPVWAENPVLLVNGEPVCNEGRGAYTEIRRVWSKGDEILLTFEPKVDAVRYTGAEQAENGAKRYALMYGPYLMSLTGEFGFDIPTVKTSVEKLKFENVEDSVRAYVNDEMVFMPYYEIDDSKYLNSFPIFED